MIKPTWESKCGRVKLWLGDSFTLVPKLQLSSSCAIIADPPYGIDHDSSHSHFKNGISRELKWDDSRSFDPSLFIKLDVPTILWGANNYASKLPDRSVWLCWRKSVRNNLKIRQAEMELAWTNCVRRPRVFQHLWIGAYRDSESGKRNVHPTQKPIALMAWCVGLIKAEIIIDPFMGSGTTGVAAVQEGRSFWGIEIDEEYFEIAKRRIKAALKRPTLEQLAKRPKRKRRNLGVIS
jgi:DNA modification methylase